MKAILFDFDGVIVDTMHLHHEATAKVFSEVGKTLSEKELAALDVMRTSDAFKISFSGMSEEKREALVAKRYAFLKEQSIGIKPFPGFLEFLFKVKGKYPLAVVSNSRKEFVEYVLNGIGGRGSFQVVLGADEVSKGKPHPGGYIKAARLLGVPIKECLVIEDAILGIKAAKDAGAKCVAVTTTYDRNFLLGADLIVDSLAELSIAGLEALFK